MQISTALPVGHSKDSVVLMDLTTHEFWRFRRADCGADCFCAARADRVTLNDDGAVAEHDHGRDLEVTTERVGLRAISSPPYKKKLINI